MRSPTCQCAAGGEVGGGVAVLGVPDEGEAIADQPERDGALDRVANSVLGLADPGALAGLAEAHLDRPASPGHPDQAGQRRAGRAG